MDTVIRKQDKERRGVLDGEDGLQIQPRTPSRASLRAYKDVASGLGLEGRGSEWERTTPSGSSKLSCGCPEQELLRGLAGGRPHTGRGLITSTEGIW